MLTLEEVNKLKEEETNLWTSFHQNYKRNTPRQTNEYIHSLLERETKQRISTNLNCPKCILEIFKKMYPIYMESKKQLEEAAQQLISIFEDGNKTEEPTKDEKSNESKGETEPKRQRTGTSKAKGKKATVKKKKGN